MVGAVPHISGLAIGKRFGFSANEYVVPAGYTQEMVFFVHVPNLHLTHPTVKQIIKLFSSFHFP